MIKYLANQIRIGALKYEAVIKKYPKYKAALDLELK